jgi:hypothetical protein
VLDFVEKCVTITIPGRRLPVDSVKLENCKLTLKKGNIMSFEQYILSGVDLSTEDSDWFFVEIHELVESIQESAVNE